MAEEAQLVEKKREHEIPPNEFRKIEEFLDKNPNRYVDARNFVNEAIKFFLAWETDPPTAHKMMKEDFTPLLKQMAYQKAQGWEQIMNQTWPGLLDKHKDEIEKFLDKNPSYRIPLYDSAPSPDSQEEARASTNDLKKLRDRQSDVLEFIEKIVFNKVQPKDNQEEIFYDGWPLISTYYSRILPAKISIIAIADLMYENQSEMIRLDENNTVKIYDIAEEFSTELKKIEAHQNLKRAGKYSTGLPKPFKEKMNASQALSEKRWKDRFIGKRRKHKDADKNSKSIEYFDGLLSALGLVRAFYAEDKKKVFLTLTAKGQEFYSMDNRFTDIPWKYIEGGGIGSFYSKERKFLVETIAKRKLEMELIKTAIQEVNKCTNGTGAVTESLDAKFMYTIRTFAESEKNLNVQKKILDEVINNTIKVQEENTKKLKPERVMTPIQSHRVATMGRLAEMGLVEWIIDKESRSTYKINEAAREQVDVILNTK